MALYVRALLPSLVLAMAIISTGHAWAGTYVDCNGKDHPWHVTKTHALMWDGKPYVPFGGMFVSSYLSNPTRQNLAMDRSRLDVDRQAGIEDLYLNPCVAPAARTQLVINMFESLGFHYGIEFPGGISSDPKRQRGYLIGTSAPALLSKRGVAKFPDSGNALEAWYIVVGAVDGRVLESGMAMRTAGDFAIRVSHCPAGGALARIVPLVSTNRWISPNANRLIAWLKPLRLGADMRFLLDPLGNEYSPPRAFLPISQKWRTAFAIWLKRRYQTIAALDLAWGIHSGSLTKFIQAARLVPLISGPRQSKWPQHGYAVDDRSGKILAINMAISRLWPDACHFRDVFLRRRADRICKQLRKFCDVPIVAKRFHQSTRIWISRNPKEGFDGLGMETYGTGNELGRFSAAATWADIAQSKRPLWCIVTETSPAHWQNRYIGFKTQTQMYRDYNLLLSLGAKGIFAFGLSLRASRGDNQWTIFELNNDPRQLEWLALFGDAARARTHWLAYVPNVAYWFPVENTDARSFMEANTPQYGLSGAWTGRDAVLDLGPGRWVAPVFYPSGLPLVLYNSQLLANPALATDAAELRSQVPPNHRCLVKLSDPVHLPPRLGSHFAMAPPTLVKLTVSRIAKDVQATLWRGRFDQQQALFQATANPVQLEIRSAAKNRIITSAMVQLPTSGGFERLALPLTVDLPGLFLQRKHFLLNNPEFGVTGAAFAEKVGAAPKGLFIRGIPLADMSVKSVAFHEVRVKFQASAGFSSTQGVKGWSYAAVNFTGAGNLVQNATMATYDASDMTWIASPPGTGSQVSLTARKQDMTEGNADWSLRYWTATRHYNQVAISGNLIAAADVGVSIVYYNAATETQTNVAGTTFVKAPPTRSIPIKVSLRDVNPGDRIYFEMQNYGSKGNGSGVMETWNPTIVASYSSPER